MWVALLFVVTVDGTPHVEADIAPSLGQCQEMRHEFEALVRDDPSIVKFESRCTRV